jgi:hypothetical protein
LSRLGSRFAGYISSGHPDPDFSLRMIVRCVRIIAPAGEELDSHPAIHVGEQYVVLTIYASPGHDVMLRVYARRPEARDAHPGPPALWTSLMFEVLANEIPSNWVAQTTDTGALRLEPESWLRPGFWEDLNEWSPLSDAARTDYERELQLILREAGVEAPS